MRIRKVRLNLCATGARLAAAVSQHRSLAGRGVRINKVLCCCGAELLAGETRMLRRGLRDALAVMALFRGLPAEQG